MVDELIAKPLKQLWPMLRPILEEGQSPSVLGPGCAADLFPVEDELELQGSQVVRLKEEVEPKDPSAPGPFP